MYDLKKRRPTRQIHIGKVAIGGGAPHLRAVDDEYEDDGHRSDRRPDPRPAGSGLRHRASRRARHGGREEPRNILRQVTVPLVADIHFDYRAALAALDAGADKFASTPATSDDDRVKAVADACNARNVPIRIGVNGGSSKSTSWPSTALPCRGHGGERHVHVRLLQKYDFE